MSRGGIIVTGGGTAGHVLPALAVARALVAGGRQPAEITYVGAARGMEARLVPAAGFSLVTLPGRGIERRISRRSVQAAAMLALGCARGLALVARRRPEAVVSIGGYAALPCALGAAALRVPLVVVNVDAVPGATNRLTGRFATACAIALPGTPLPRAVLTGAPVRPEVLAVDRTPEGRSAARRALGLPEDRLVVAFTGGSLGARRLNLAAIGLARAWAARHDLVVVHVAGERDLDWARVQARDLAGANGLEYRLVGYEERLPALFAAADVVVARAGASTIAELTVIGTPSVLVPLPGAPGDHQRLNAERLAEAGAALLVEDAAASAEELARVLDALLGEDERRRAMGEAARRLGRPDAAERVASLVEEAARRAPRRVGSKR
ncbi:MAG: glycosyltransferase [Actinomycetota bacterium]|nr:glycosyltransferase [Actinomycetota bacterium]